MAHTATALPPLPPLPQLTAALRKTTVRIAAELLEASDMPPDWSDLEWRMAMAASVMHGVSALLASRLRWRGPPLWLAFLAEQKEQGLLRQRRIEALLAAIGEATTQAGIPVVPLKGSALLKLGLYAAGERPMSDIDLLLRPQDQQALREVFVRLGYVVEFEIWKHLCLGLESKPAALAFGEHADNPIKIDLHTRICERLPLREWDITAQILPKTLEPGLNAYPSRLALLRHFLLHTAGNLQAHGLRLIQLQDLALLMRTMHLADWEELLAGDGGDASMWWAWPPLLLVERYFPTSVPPNVLSRLGRTCPPLLRWLAPHRRLEDISLSKTRIPAFPGIEWTQSPLDAAQLVLSRLMPSRQSRLLQRQLGAVEPVYRATTFTAQAQYRKILRWLFSRTPRTAVVYSIQRALAYRAA